MTGGDGEATDIIGHTGRADKVGQTVIGLARRFDVLLAQVMQGRQYFAAAVVGVKDNIVALPVGGEKANHGRGRSQSVRRGDLAWPWHRRTSLPACSPTRASLRISG